MDSFLHLSPDLPENSLFLEIDGVKTLAAHGHQFRVHNTMKELAREARRTRAGLVLFGHTHSPFMEEANGTVFFNPGAVKSGSYGIVTLDAGKVVSAAHYTID
jgi:putative phosphoesterase